ncbi:MAG: hypothetical protein HY067_23205 [Betaproteobacteria bacterium]|nr:hypothetical protein [Betaproteobacteria bacterium]
MVELPPSTPLTCHATTVLVAFLTVAVNGTVAPPTTALAELGAIAIVTGFEGAAAPPEPPPQAVVNMDASTAAYSMRCWPAPRHTNTQRDARELHCGMWKGNSSDDFMTQASDSSLGAKAVRP